MMTITHTSPAVRDAVAALNATITAHTCRICGKFETHRHTSETRAAHMEHLTRHGWSGMCPAPQN